MNSLLDNDIKISVDDIGDDVCHILHPSLKILHIYLCGAPRNPKILPKMHTNEQKHKYCKECLFKWSNM